MSKPQKPFITPRRGDSNTFQITINPTSGLPRRVCQEWQRRSFQDLPDALAQFRSPKTKASAQTAALALIKYIEKTLEQEGLVRAASDHITVGEWVKRFTSIETSPMTSKNAAKNRPYSPDTLDTYRGYYNSHIKDDPLAGLKMSEVEEYDMLTYINRLSMKKKKNGEILGGTRTFAGTLIFLRMAFKEYQMKNKRWINPFLFIGPPRLPEGDRDALTEDEVVKLFMPGVLKDTMEFAVCAVMFLSGLRCGEIGALKPESLDWHTPKIKVKHSWQRYDHKDRVLGPTKSKKARDAPFDPLLQDAIKKLWAENGQKEFVFSEKDGSYLRPGWIRTRFPKWLDRAGIKADGRKIVPHSSRHSLASLLEERGISLRYIQDMLGHSDLKTTKRYLHSTSATIKTIGNKISEAMKPEAPNIASISGDTQDAAG
jgi:integrase/recombinase XerD